MKYSTTKAYGKLSSSKSHLSYTGTLWPPPVSLGPDGGGAERRLLPELYCDAPKMLENKREFGFKLNTVDETAAYMLFEALYKKMKQ